MKKLSLLFFFAAFILAATPGFSQKKKGIPVSKEATKALNSAKKAYQKYTLDRGANAGSLGTAIESIGTAFADEGIKAKPAAWLLKANIFNEVMSDQTGIYSMKYPDAVDNAYEAYAKVASMEGAKKFEVKAANTALNNVSAGFSQKGATLFAAKDYAGAAKAFMQTVKISGEMGIGDDNEDQQNALYNAGLAAMNAGDNEIIIATMTRLLAAGNDKSNVYEGLYKAYKDTDTEKALDYLSQGRAKHPQDNGLLTTEINHYLAAGKLEVLEDKLLQALEAEPTNKTLHMVTGSMYEKLSNNAAEAKDAATAKSYFEKAEQYYNSAIENDAEYFDAIYSLGALYFNKTTPMRKEMNELPYSEQARFDALKAEVGTLMDKSLPYFQKADKLNDKDYSTIFALKEIYARKDDLTKSNEYKARLEALGKK